MKNYLLVSGIVVGALLVSACGKQEYDNTEAFDRLTLPAATTTGSQTFACRIDGTLWTTFGKYEQSAFLGRAWEENRLSVYIAQQIAGRRLVESRGTMSRVRRSKPTYEARMTLRLRALDTLGTGRTLLPRFQEDLEYQSFFPGGFTYRNLARNPIRITVTRFDEANLIFSGTFEGYLYSFDATDSVRVTDGRFDVKLPY